jgi:hypothetical protein
MRAEVTLLHDFPCTSGCHLPQRFYQRGHRVHVFLAFLIGLLKTGSCLLAFIAQRFQSIKLTFQFLDVRCKFLACLDRSAFTDGHAAECTRKRLSAKLRRV